MILRKFEEADFEVLTALWHRTNVAAYPYVAAHQAHTLQQARNFFRAQVLPQHEVWVVAVDGAPAGLIAVNATHITQFAVAPEFQGKGLGSALLAQILKTRSSDLKLFTFQANALARRFYERRGFRAIAFGVSPAPESEPDVEYLWQRPQQLAGEIS